MPKDASSGIQDLKPTISSCGSKINGYIFGYANRRERCRPFDLKEKIELRLL